MPAVLRRREALHAYIGSAYTDGIMNGEEYHLNHAGIEESVLQ
jgi:hypothetical protein